MKRNRILILGLIFFSLGFLSCSKKSPQIPSNKVIVVDENAAALLTINKDLAQKEDSLLTEFAKGKSFKKHETGFWYKVEQSGNGSKIGDKSTCEFSCKLLLLNGNLIQKDKKQVTIGKKEIVAGLEDGLKLLHKGDSATFIIPWYLGYGMKGNEPLVPPFTSIIYQIKLNN